GVSTQFNIAATGHVSGISYSYKGLVITGSKLGNDFKWTTLKTKIDYKQERDLSVMRLANVRIKLDPDSGSRNHDHHSTSPQSLSEFEDKGLSAMTTRKPAQESTDSSKRGNRGNKRFQENDLKHSKAFPEKSSVFLLTSLLDSHSDSGIHQSTFDTPINLRNRRRRKKRKRR
ncbi:MAG: hypothetical protein ABJA70_19335, partial [Chryseolinea sp.]